MKKLREITIEAIRIAIDPSQEGRYREAYDKAADAIRNLPDGTFSDELHVGAPK